MYKSAGYIILLWALMGAFVASAALDAPKPGCWEGQAEIAVAHQKVTSSIQFLFFNDFNYEDVLEAKLKGKTIYTGFNCHDPSLAVVSCRLGEDGRVFSLDKEKLRSSSSYGFSLAPGSPPELQLEGERSPTAMVLRRLTDLECGKLIGDYKKLFRNGEWLPSDAPAAGP